MEVAIMKAIIMAGGEGTRLRPLSANKPKPMVELLDRPVLEHILGLLKKHGVTEACLTLKYLPQMITAYFGSGERFGISLDYRIESQALGTAGGVLNCADFIGDEDFIVISGDCVCDLDLRALMDFHREKHAEATLALYSHEEPCEYGLVVTEEDGRIARFVEKPAWDHVLTDQVNTGIYVLHPSVLEEIPKGRPYDFGRDLFPQLLAEKRGMYGLNLTGYWCDVGCVGAYMTCCRDMLGGGIKAEMGAPLQKEGVWCAGALPEGCVLEPPVYIGADAVIDKGSEIGPYAVIGAASVIASGAVIRHSVVNGAIVGENASINGAVVCRGALIGRGTEICEGAAVGEGSLIGDGCVVAAGSRIWPDRQIRSGTLVTGTVSHGLLKSGLTFTQAGVLSGDVGVGLTADTSLRLGEAAAGWGRVGIGWRGGEAARVLAEAFGCGVCAAGGELIRHDGSFLSCASYAGQVFSLPLAVFIEEKKDVVSLTFFGKDGMTITRDNERKFEAALNEGHKTAPRLLGSATTVMGVVDAYVSAAVKAALLPAGCAGALAVSAPGSGGENRALKAVLSRLGCEVSDRENGLVRLEATCGGLGLAACDEDGCRLSDEQLKVLSAFVELSFGAKRLAVQYDAPAAIDILAKDFGADALRIGRDGPEAEALGSEQPALRDGVFAGARLCAYLRSSGETLSALRKKMPRFSSMTREIPLKGDRGTAMRLMSSCCTGMAMELTAGLRLDTERGSVTISPLRERSALRIRTESMSEETAEELCAEFERRALENDKE
jgi:mannose-1-phosphate guanylyltransferase/phosphomannomutase